LECERLQGFPDSWTLPDKDYVVPIRGIETNRYHAIGNAVCVPVVQWIAGRISGILQNSVCCESVKNITIRDRLGDLAKIHLSSKCEIVPLLANSDEEKWKSGGIAYKEWVTTATVSSSPTTPVVSQLINVIEREKVHQRYFLSANAAQGILRRVDKLGRHLFPPLEVVLRRIAAPDSALGIASVEAEEDGQGNQLVAL